MKRVAREAWRLGSWGDTARPPLAMFKLRRADAQWKTLSASARKKVWRSELDELVARLVCRLAAAGPARAPAPSAP
jgi:hypothetical protein